MNLASVAIIFFAIRGAASVASSVILYSRNRVDTERLYRRVERTRRARAALAAMDAEWEDTSGSSG